MAKPSLPCPNARCWKLQSECTEHQRKPWHGTRGYERTISGWEWARRVARVLQRDGGVCRLGYAGCTGVATTADHLVGAAQWAASGFPPEARDAEDNLQASCQHCNEVKRRQQSLAGRQR